MDVFDLVKSRYPAIDDVALAMYVAEVGQAIKTYTNQQHIPADLLFVHTNMVLDLIDGDKRRTDPEAPQTVSSIKEGDVTVQFGNSRVEAKVRTAESLLFDYASQLNKFRKMRW